MTRHVKYPFWLVYSAVAAPLFIIVLMFLFPVPSEAARNVSPVVKDQNGQWMTGFTVEEGTWRIRADLTEIDERLIERLIMIEDKRFFNHSGVDILAVFRASRSWTRAGKAVSGASTITMQLVRQLEPRPRTLGSKMIESIRAVQYDLLFSKNEILELYLSHIPYGGNIEGIHAASQIYFGKPPFQLTDGEIALLIALPQAPEARRPDIRPKTAVKGRNIILDKLQVANMMTPQQVQEAKETPVVTIRTPMPEQAWITSRGLAQKTKSITTTLDYGLQQSLESLSSQFIKPIEAPVNVAITIVENSTMAVRAHIASADRTRPGGWIDMSDRARSPGSTLKPFIYGMAMDDGLLASGSFIRDVPTRFGSYQPENFNRRYYGDVRIYEALRHSLNVPAVAVLDQVGGERLESTLQAAGVDITRLGSRSENAGLALALGGAGITVNDLAIIYAALANGGTAKNLRWLETDETAPYRLLSERTAIEITQILRQAPTPQGRMPSWLGQNVPAVAYKTGTSYGFRDAWAAGYTNEWTVIVWVGRPDGGARRGETGRLAAAPLLFDIFSLLPHSSGGSFFSKDTAAPIGLKQVANNEDGPQILFPSDGSEILALTLGEQGRGFTLSARSKSGRVNFYINETLIQQENGKVIWRPDSPGFYDVKAIDTAGKIARSKVEVLSMEYLDVQ